MEKVINERVVVAYSVREVSIWLEKGKGLFPEKIEFESLEQATATANNILKAVEILKDEIGVPE